MAICEFTIDEAAPEVQTCRVCGRQVSLPAGVKKIVAPCPGEPTVWPEAKILRVNAKGSPDDRPRSRKSIDPPGAIRDLEQLDCVHLTSIGTGHVKACCGGSGLVDVGACDLGKRCTVFGGIVDGKKTTNCNRCEFREPKCAVETGKPVG